MRLTQNLQHPYNWRVDVPNMMKYQIPVEDVRRWANEVGMDCNVMASRIYFHTEQDALMFMLRWA